MPEITDMLYQPGVPDKGESQRLNLERRALDNEWLYTKVQEGLLTQEAFTQLQIIKDMCEFIYPDNWDLEVIVNTSLIKIEITPDQITDILPIQTMGAYFGFELPEPGEPRDENMYYMNNYLNENTYMYYYDSRLGRENEDATWTTVNGPNYLTFRIIINLPEITITNSKNRSRKIYDIQFSAIFSPKGVSAIQITESYPSNQSIDTSIIQHRFNHTVEVDDIQYTIPLGLNKYILLQGLQSRRLTLTKTEYSGRYLHSHSQSRDEPQGFTNWGNCCLGSSVESILSTFMMLSQEFTPELFTLWLHQVQAYAEWESLEGGPHTKMSALGMGGIIADFPRANLTDISIFIIKIQQHKKNNPLVPTPIDWQITPKGHYKVIENEKLINFCKIHEVVNQYPIGLAFHKTMNGELYAVASRTQTFIPPSSDDLREAKFLFRGEWRQFNILEDEDNIELSDEYVIHPEVIKHIKLKLERYASHQKIRDDIARRANQINNQYRNLSENSVSV